ncbi:hypothetical protein [Algoriphagus halophilus]|uniref:Two component regulator propeller n=1 Tax=Algoriphagus halophilus TaxID=226505 RepID=A0A1N6EC34_9BACT|nr:hypothetical protein [Algoriphagus halophilus]SIN80589.1 hypothetical protein SAMN05444394_1962 [Algoriphagus halophilus]
MKTNFSAFSLVLIIGLISLDSFGQSGSGGSYIDRPFIQEYSIVHAKSLSNPNQYSLASNQHGSVQLVEDHQLLKPFGGQFQHWGTLVKDLSYLPMADKQVQAIASYQGEFIYLDNKAVFSNAWAGSLYLEHRLPAAYIIDGGNDFDFLISDGKQVQYVNRDGKELILPAPNKIIAIEFDPVQNGFWVLSSEKLFLFDPQEKNLTEELSTPKMTSLSFHPEQNRLIVGTESGYFTYDIKAKIASELHAKLPWDEINVVEAQGDKIWFGTSKGAFVLLPNGDSHYYYLERWLPGEEVLDIAFGNGEVYLLTDQGLGTVVQTEMTLAEKAKLFDRYTKKNHLRHGFNASLKLAEPGKLETGVLDDSDNDGLWTSMYLASQGFRYAMTQDPEAMDQIRQSLLAMERLFTINPVAGFPSRSFERSGYIEKLSDPERWQHAPNPEWDWKSTTSSDEAIGHMFVYAVLAELVEDDWVKNKSIELMDTLMTHILDHDLYLIDFDGKPTQWGKWNPEYVNQFPIQVGDRKLNSSNIISMLQTAYHFTGKERFKEKAFELMEKEGYLENLMRPMSIIGQAGDGSDSYSQMLSESWNHSDDEMYFLGYWGLYKYAFNEELKANYKTAILDHWNAERPEKDGLWNIFGALVQPEKFDLNEAIWFLQEHPIDLINWNVKNSHRKDIQALEPNFRRQSISQVLSPSETRIARHNANRFNLDGNGNGRSVYSAGDIWLLPYWMGRYLKVIQ